MNIVFGDIVVVDQNHIGVVVKCWGRSSNGREPHFEVYVRSYNSIREYPASKVERYLVRHKELYGDELMNQQIVLEEQAFDYPEKAMNEAERVKL